MTTPIQTHRRLPPIPPLQIPSGTLVFSAHDLIKMEKEILKKAASIFLDHSGKDTH